ncbi:hypothetical protein F4808DRAFT_237920 [Astrocystis sublimbata]|nr:hypothetical protein F4808DRAFT_237920 [Astrocystis sublimbata]
MADYGRIKITTYEPQYMRSHSFSHRHRPHRTRLRCPENCACVGIEEWDDLVVREQSARAANDRLMRENRVLKRENQRLLDQLPSREDEIASKFRRKIIGLKTDLERKDSVLHGLEKDGDLANRRIRELTKTVKDQSDENTQLQDRIDALDSHRRKDQSALKEALARVHDLQRQLLKYREYYTLYRRYDFT